MMGRMTTEPPVDAWSVPCREQAEEQYRLAWLAYLGQWGKGGQHRWRLQTLSRWMDELRPRITHDDRVWAHFTATLPGFIQYWGSHEKWVQHRRGR